MSNIFSDKNAENLREITLNHAIVGRKYVINACNYRSDACARLAEMGLVPGTVVSVIKAAPLGDPLEISVRGYSLCIRAAEAQSFSLTEISQ